MIGKPGPFQIIEDAGSGAVDSPMIPPRRRYACAHYQTCLDLAATLNWDNFTCRGCSGEVSETLVWRAGHRKKEDVVAETLCHIPSPSFLTGRLGTLIERTKEDAALGLGENEDRELLAGTNPKNP